MPFAWQCSADTEDDVERLRRGMEDKNYLHVGADDMRSLISRGQADALQDWPRFLTSWARLPVDLYMADGGKYRRRRFSVVSASHLHSELRTETYSRTSRALAITISMVGSCDILIDRRRRVRRTVMRSLLPIGLEIFNRLAPDNDWRIELGQFRIEAREQRRPPYTGGKAPRRRKFRDDDYDRTQECRRR